MTTYNKPRLVIYTTLLGDKETLGNPLSEISNDETDLDISYVCFTDSNTASSDIWNLKILDLQLLTTDKMCRQVKCLPHQFFPDFQYSLWIDNIVKLKRLPNTDDLKTENKYLFKLFIHSGRSSLFEEACAIHGLGYESSEVILNQMEHYSKFINLSSVSPLSTTTVIFREHHHPKVIQFGNTWWSHILNFSKRDQLSFDFVRCQLGTEVQYIAGTKMDNDLVYPQENFSSSRVLANFDEKKYSYIHHIPQSQSAKAKGEYFNSHPDMQRSNTYARRNSVFSLILNLSHSGMTSRFSPRRSIDAFLNSKLSPYTDIDINILIVNNPVHSHRANYFSDEEIKNFTKAINIFLPKSFSTESSKLPKDYLILGLKPLVLFDIILLFNYDGLELPNVVEDASLLINKSQGSVFVFSSESLNLSNNFMEHLDNKVHLSLNGSYNDVNNMYFDNSVLCLTW